MLRGKKSYEVRATENFFPIVPLIYLTSEAFLEKLNEFSRKLILQINLIPYCQSLIRTCLQIDQSCWSLWLRHCLYHFLSLWFRVGLYSDAVRVDSNFLEESSFIVEFLTGALGRLNSTPHNLMTAFGKSFLSFTTFEEKL